MSLDELDRWQLIYCRKYPKEDPLRQVETIGNLLEQFNVKRCVADIGYGSVQVSELQKRFGDRVLGCQYVSRPGIPLEKVYRDEFGKRIAQMMVSADRSFWIEQVIQNIKHQLPSGKVYTQIIIPWKDQKKVEWIIDQFTCIEMEETETVSGKTYHRYTHPEGEPDDALHACVYAFIAEYFERLSPDLVIQDLFD